MKKIYKRILSAFLAAALITSASPVSFAADGAQFEVKPYLLAPKTDGMTIAWEADTATEATIAIGTEETQLDGAVSVSADADAPSFNGEQMQFYSYEATGLQPDTQYYYEVKLGDDVSCKGSFRTLPEDPDEVKLLFVTDTHKFETAEQFNSFVYSFNPDVIIHTGDIPEGTGTQKEQFSYWFDSGDFIQNYPVVYCPGNHDYGEFYDEYFGKPQAKAYSSSENGDNYSFDIGNVHIIMMDSNPWGLLQMNIETAGGTITADLQATIDSALSWLEQDLQSEEAQNASFRIIGMHHPYGDSFTKRYIPDLIEKYNVDLFLGGHTHSYSMSVSANPAIGAGTVYINGQDARSSSGNGDWGTIIIQDNLLTFTNYGAGVAKQSYVLATEKQKLTFSDITIEPDEILSNGSVNITATVTNTGEGLAAAALPVYDNGTLRYVYALATKAGGSTSTVQLLAGESETLYGTLTLSELGEHTLQLADYTATVNVSFREASYEVSNLRVKLGDDEISDIESDRLHLKADISNIGNESGIATAEFLIDDEVIDSQQYQVGAGETATAEFGYEFAAAGTYTAAIRVGEEVVSKKITIEGSIQGMPMVYDKSGNGNDAYIHGTPTLSKDDDGNVALVLNEGVRVGSNGKDYIEVPDDGSIRIESGVTGMIWAKWLHDVSNATFDHFPLMVKGPSISQGVNYQYRMAIRKTGKLTYGIGFDNENGEFFWNDNDADVYGAKPDTWVMYAGAFDAVTGGVSYANGVESGRIDPPDYEAEITNWEGSPLLVGMSHFYTLRPNRNRGAYNTTLSAEVSQIRYYDASVGQEEIEGLVDNPFAEGASGDNLLVWLDFNNIVQQGSHTTEWRSVNDVQALQYTAEIGGNAAIEATVQVSDDQSAIVAEKTVALTDGTNTIDLSDLADAAYVRIVTKFTSDLNETQSFVPVLREYVVKTADGDHRWNTAASFSKGTFEGAAAHQSEDFYAVGVSDFDDYSGTASEPYEPGTSGGGSGSSSGGGGTAATKPSASVSGSGGKVAVGNDGTVTITPDAGYQIAKITVNGKEVEIPADGKLTGLDANDKVVVTFEKAASSTLPFADVKAGDWFYDAVQYVYENGMMNGTSDTMFNPNATTTRGMIVTILHRLEGEPTAAASDFSDVAAGTWYADAVAWAAEQGIVNGVSETSFAPDSPITREQLAAILYRYAQHKGYDVTAAADLQAYSDASQISAYALTAMKWANAEQLITGSSATTLGPQGNATRAQVATILMRFCESVEYDAAA